MAWFDLAWAFRKRATLSLAVIPAAVTDFPALLKVPADADFAAEALANGDDFVVTDSDETTQLAHEIQKYDNVTGELIIWISAPAIAAGTDRVFYIYYGNPASPNQQNPAGVWDSKYIAVWHLTETVGPGNTFFDSTSNGNDVVQNGNGFVNAAGLWDTTVEFQGAGGQRSLDGTDFSVVGTPTFQAWCNYSDITRQARAMGKQNGASNGAHDYLLGIDTTPNGEQRYRQRAGGNTTDLDVNVFPLIQNQWYLQVNRLNPTAGEMEVFQGDVTAGVWRGIIGTANKGNPSDSRAGLPNRLMGGTQESHNMEGLLEEPRISIINIDEDELEFRFNLEQDPTTTTGPWTLGSQETPPVPPAALITGISRKSNSGPIKNELFINMVCSEFSVPGNSSIDVSVSVPQARVNDVIVNDANGSLEPNILPGPDRVSVNGTVVMRFSNLTNLQIDQPMFSLSLKIARPVE